MDLAAICTSKKRDDKTTCKTLSLYRDGKTGTFDTIDDKKHRYEWLFVDGNVAVGSILRHGPLRSSNLAHLDIDILPHFTSIGLPAL